MRDAPHTAPHLAENDVAQMTASAERNKEA